MVKLWVLEAGGVWVGVGWIPALPLLRANYLISTDLSFFLKWGRVIAGPASLHICVSIQEMLATDCYQK